MSQKIERANTLWYWPNIKIFSINEAPIRLSFRDIPLGLVQDKPLRPLGHQH